MPNPRCRVGLDTIRRPSHLSTAVPPSYAAFDHRRAATAVVNLHVGPNPQGLGVP